MEAGQERMSALEEQQRLNEESAAATESETIIADIDILERERDNTQTCALVIVVDDVLRDVVVRVRERERNKRVCL